MLATPSTPAEVEASQDEYAYEMKWDGVRSVVYLAGGRAKLVSRRGRDDTPAYPDVVEALTGVRGRDRGAGRRDRGDRRDRPSHASGCCRTGST